MRRELPGGFELDDDVSRVDLDEVVRFLSEESYWAGSRSVNAIELLVRAAARVVGLYEGERQVGFARTDLKGEAYAYLADVYVIEELRGKGLGTEIVRESVDNGPFAHWRWRLNTSDAYSLYEKFGFCRLDEATLMERKAS